MDVKNKKVLFISYDGMTDQLGQSQVIPYLKALTKRRTDPWYFTGGWYPLDHLIIFNPSAATVKNI